MPHFTFFAAFVVNNKIEILKEHISLINIKLFIE